MGTPENGRNGYPSSDGAPVAPKITMRVLEQGDQKSYPKNGQMIVMHYIGYIAATGNKFDSSLDRGQPLTIQLGASSIIPGFEEGVRKMSLGERSRIFIPAALGYGSRGSGSVVPPDADLFFEVKVLSIAEPPTEEESTSLRNSKAGGSLDLLSYLLKSLHAGGDIDLVTFDSLLPGADVNASASSVSMKSLSLLHIVSQLAEGNSPQVSRTILKKVVAAGADLDAKDGYGETPISTVLCMLDEEEKNEDENDPDPPDANLMETLVCYLEFDQQKVTDVLATQIQHQVGRISDKKSALWSVGHTAIALVARRIGEARLEEIRQGIKLIDYLCTFFDTLEGADPNIVRSFLEAGACPAVVQPHSGSNAFHFIALNAYGEYEQIFQIFSMLFAKNPQGATASDRSNFTPFSLAADYKDTASQFKCKPNACPMLALAELLPQYDIDAAFVCLKVDAASRTRSETPAAAKQLRFMEGDRVKCWVSAPGGSAWEEGVVVACGYRENTWPANHPAAPYEVKLDIGGNVFALSDTDKLIVPEQEKVKSKTDQETRPGKSQAGKRFVKQSTENGWQLFDHVTGKARPCSPPDSDSD